MDYTMGIDVGTTSTKCVLYDLNGQIIAHADKGYQLYQTKPGMAEEDPEEIFEAVIKTMQEVLKNIDSQSLKFVSFSTAMHSLILMDDNDRPITKAITWADNRAVKYSDELIKSGLGAEIYAKTGTPIHPMAPLSKMLWLKKEHSDLFDRAKKFIDIKSYIFFKLFGIYKIDYSIASATGMFNIFNLKWEPQVLNLLNIEEARLPEVVPTTNGVTGISEKYQERLGIGSDIPFVFGASDGVLSNLGLNAIDPGVVAVTIGTSGAVRVVVDKPVIDPNGNLFCYALTKNKWVVGGPVNNGGIVFRWVRDQLFDSKVSYDELTKMANEVPAGSKGLLFQPYLGGERAPIWNAYARGSFFGLTRQHTRSDMVRSSLEGIVFNLYAVMCLIEKITGKPVSIQATGGFARSSMWRQMLADIFDQDVVVPESFESSCLGAVVLGMYAQGYIDDLSAVKDMVGITEIHHPDPKNVKVYQELFPIWQRITHALEPEYKQIAKFQDR
ncbi:gluconokinase [Companilactobacillus baiquanensis]|uniref:Gluconokinase n=1 Tax=Companilactobacillus baiquanensis TaxID=2486005 RepID=A0ABW1UUP3_9LACO|nr:gluconokinase [Companilactobacillus baiquanensis]